MRLNLINFTHSCKIERLSRKRENFVEVACSVLLVPGIWNGAPDPGVKVCGRLCSALCCGYRGFCAWFAAACS